MRKDMKLALPNIPDHDVILERLDRVLDPELDESILRLGFIESLDAEDGHLTIVVHLPTYFCAPNFAYMMAEDIRHKLLTVESVKEVTIQVKDHVASEAIEAGVNSGKTFAEAFPGEAFENLAHLRGLFLRKGYMKRQADLLQGLRNAGLSFGAISALRIEDVSCENGICQVRCADSQAICIGPAEVAQRYFDRRAELGLDSSPATPLITNLQGNPISPEQLEHYFIRVRTVRISLEANGSLCSALLAQRKTAAIKASSAQAI